MKGVLDPFAHMQTHAHMVVEVAFSLLREDFENIRQFIPRLRFSFFFFL